MAERSQFWPTGTTGDGAAAIDQGQTLEWFRDLFTPHTAAGASPTQGVLYGVLGGLKVTSAPGGVSPVTVAAGAAVVEGFYYKNDAPVNFVIPASGSVRVDLIVLRADWAARTVRLVRKAGTEGSVTPPALTQVAGATWEITIAAITSAAGFVDIAMPTTSIARPAGWVPLLRQGGSATVWGTTGTTNYTPTEAWAMQTGVRTASGTTLSVTFPTPFATNPVVIVSNGALTAVTTNTFTATVPSNQVTQWIAIGPLRP
jgi:hypothetical protein